MIHSPRFAVIGNLAMLYLLKKCCAAALVAAFFPLCVVQAADFSAFPDPLAAPVPLSARVDAEVGFAVIDHLPVAERSAFDGRLIVLEVDLANSPGFSLEVRQAGREARYRMGFNNVAEGWNWYPLADPQREDYYRAKFLPLKSLTVERGDYAHEDKIGETQRMQVIWRYDYFLSFDNLYDFYVRTTDDDAGFVATLPDVGEPGVRMFLLLTLTAPYVSDSTTFWKATHGKPTDFTLKKRYVHGVLREVWFCDASGKRILARLRPSGPAR